MEPAAVAKVLTCRRLTWTDTPVRPYLAMGLALTADGSLLYAAAGENKEIVKIATATNKQVGAIKIPGIVHESTLTLDGKYLYVTLRKANKIVVVRTADDKIVATVPQRAYPDLVTMEPSAKVLASRFGSSSVRSMA